MNQGESNNYDSIEITDQLLDSLSKYPQGSNQDILYYQLVLKRYPNTHEAYMSMSVSYNKRAEHAKGFEILNQAVELAPIQNLGYRAFVKLYMMHDYKGALGDCLKLDTLTSFTKPGVWGEDIDHVIGLCYLQLEDLKNAQNYLSNSIQRTTKKYGKKWNSHRVFLYLALIHYKKEEFKQAIEVLNQVIEIHSNYAEAYYYLSLCYKKLNYVSKAIKAARDCKQKFIAYGAEKNQYFEMPYQIYQSMISELMNK